MKSKAPRSYSSPLREARAQATRERILAAVAGWLEGDAAGEFTLDAVAAKANVERRTVFRHFATKEALLAAFWNWINDRIGPRALPSSLEEWLAGPRQTFPRFDAQAGLIRASLHSKTGQAMRLAAVPARRKAIRAALREVTRDASPAERRHLEAVMHTLYSAAAWETMRDYAGLSGRQAGEAASWAMTILVKTVQAGRPDPARDAVPAPSSSTQGV